jgi:2-haloacid dehalogenase
MKPKFITFDIFGTVLDWRTGTISDLRAAGIGFHERDFDQIVKAQGQDEQERYDLYSNVVARSLVKVAGLAPERAASIGRVAGEWPLFSDSRAAMGRLQAMAPCCAITNSDRVHGEQVQKQLGFSLSHWICAEDARVYKPNPEFWRTVARLTGHTLGRDWWHVSAYGDYDLSVARSLGLTCVFIERPHSVAGPADHTFANLTELADAVTSDA